MDKLKFLKEHTGRKLACHGSPPMSLGYRCALANSVVCCVVRRFRRRRLMPHAKWGQVPPPAGHMHLKSLPHAIANFEIDGVLLELQWDPSFSVTAKGLLVSPFQQHSADFPKFKCSGIDLCPKSPATHMHSKPHNSQEPSIQ